MSELMTIKVSDAVAHFATQLAMRKHQPREEALSDFLESAVNETPVESLSDNEVLALAEMRFSDEQDAALSELLARQREEQLDDEGRQELEELMRAYEKGSLRKAQALRIAIERGLRAPLRFNQQ